MWRAIASNALTLFIVILVAGGGAAGLGAEQYRPVPGPLTERSASRWIAAPR
jgi:UPF0755 protein